MNVTYRTYGTKYDQYQGLQARFKAEAELAEKEREHALGRASAFDDQRTATNA